MKTKVIQPAAPAPAAAFHGGDLALAHGLARVGLGVNIALHGLVRVPDISGFSNGLVEQFSGTFLPSGMVYLSGYGIVIAEVVIGLLLLVGLYLRASLAAGMVLMIVLLFGTCLIQNWGTASSQMIYLGFYAALLATVAADRYSVDARWRNPR
jgi:thiosulfate dehydrogenase (quinone) large subunit